MTTAVLVPTSADLPQQICLCRSFALGFISSVLEWDMGQWPLFWWIWWGRGQCQQLYFVSPHNSDRQHYGVHFLVDIYKGILKGSSLSGRDPVQTLQLRNKSGSFYSNNWGAHHMPIGLWQPQRKEGTPSNVQFRFWSLQYQSQHLSMIQQQFHTKERHGSLPYKKQPSCQKIKLIQGTWQSYIKNNHSRPQ